DIVFDTLGGEHTLKAFRVLKPGGCVVSVAGPPDREMIAKFGRNLFVRAVMQLMSRRVHAAARAGNARYFRYLTESNGAQLRAIAELVDAGAVRPVVDRVFDFSDAVAAFDYLMSGHAQGKVILDMELRPVEE
ncbi:MAG: zinc-binding dehydrogenase, partial [Pseudomonas sp.]|nr:zinc-binding dehydrogenase [Pseudomonas sp.]